MLTWSPDPEVLVEAMERQSVKIEVQVRRVLLRAGLALSAQGEDALHGAIMEGIGVKLEAEGALKFLGDPGSA